MLLKKLLGFLSRKQPQNLRHFPTLLKTRISGFSLIEISIVLMIVGLLAGAAFKGYGLLERAKIHSILESFKTYHHAVSLYRQTYGAMPGDDPYAQNHFGVRTQNGDGNGVIMDDDEKKLFWEHLYYAKQSSTLLPPVSPLGGNFQIIYENGDNYLTLVKGDKLAGLTPEQAQQLKKKMEESGAGDDFVIISDIPSVGEKCLLGDEGRFNIATKLNVCAVKAKLQ